MDQILTELRQEIGKLEESIERLQSSSPVSSSSTISIVGSTGLSVAIGCAVITFVIALFVCVSLNGKVDKQDAYIIEQNHKIERMQDYLNAIYAQAPQLKPKEQNP
jgi:prefoldin subunit 5